VRAEIQRVFGLATKKLTLLTDVDFAFDAARGQYHSTKILEKLATKAPPHALKVLAITSEDLFIPILTYVYGEAQLGGKSAILSVQRLREEMAPVGAEKVFHSRVAKEAVHELGHTFKLRHCRDAACIMHYCRNIRDVDRKMDQLCRYCRVMLKDELEKLRPHCH
jgi:archaemetzincin